MHMAILSTPSSKQVASFALFRESKALCPFEFSLLCWIHFFRRGGEYGRFGPGDVLAGIVGSLNEKKPNTKIMAKKGSRSRSRGRGSGSKGSKGKKACAKAKHENPWITHLCKYAKDHNMKYHEALQSKEAKAAYKKK
jgi:hypothetical protein